MFFVPRHSILLLVVVVVVVLSAVVVPFVQGQSAIRGGGSRTRRSTMTERFLLSSSSNNNKCNNTAPSTEVDQGCTARCPMCTQSSGWQPPASVAGDKCARCINIYDSDTDVDVGCSQTFPRCKAPLGLAGLQCLAPAILTCTNMAIDATAD